jgi:hypothetical protein
MFAALLEPTLRDFFIDPSEDPHNPRGWRCPVEMTRPEAATAQKELRIIQALEPVTTNHRLVFTRQVAENQRLQHQYTRITRQRNCLEHDDELDALAANVARWKSILNLSPERRAEKRRLEAQKKLLAKYARTPIQRPTWISHQ